MSRASATLATEPSRAMRRDSDGLRCGSHAWMRLRPMAPRAAGRARPPGIAFAVREGALVLERELRKDKISGWRWLLGAWGVGTSRQNDSIDVRYDAPDGSPRVAEGLEIEAG